MSEPIEVSLETDAVSVCPARLRCCGDPGSVVVRARPQGDVDDVPSRCEAWAGVGGPSAAGLALAAAGGAAGSGAAADLDRATDLLGRDPLVLPAAGRRAGRRGHADLKRHHRPNLAPLRRATVA